MIYSVWKPERREYAYYEGPDRFDVPVPNQLLGKGSVGIPPEAAAWRLPAGARPVGHGKTAQGLIATGGGMPLGLFDDRGMNWIVVGGLALAAWGLWKTVR